MKRLKKIKSGIASHNRSYSNKANNLGHSDSVLGEDNQTKLPQYYNLKKEFI